MIKQNNDELFNSPREVVLGNPKGDVTLVEFFDYNCAYCRRAHADMKQLIAEDPNLRVVLKEFPILGDGSVAAAQVAVAVLLTAPDKYAAFHDELITEPGQVDGAKALAVAVDLGMDADKLKVVAASDEAKANINEVRDPRGQARPDRHALLRHQAQGGGWRRRLRSAQAGDRRRPQLQGRGDLLTGAVSAAGGAFPRLSIPL